MPARGFTPEKSDTSSSAHNLSRLVIPGPRHTSVILRGISEKRRLTRQIRLVLGSLFNVRPPHGKSVHLTCRWIHISCASRTCALIAPSSPLAKSALGVGYRGPNLRVCGWSIARVRNQPSRRPSAAVRATLMADLLGVLASLFSQAWHQPTRNDAIVK